MVLFDIIILVVLALALFQGFRRGLIIEVMGLASIIIAGYAAYYLTSGVAELLEWDFDYATQLTFVLVFLAFLFGVVIVARIITKILKVVGLGIINQIGGAAVAMLKYLVVLAILLSFFIPLNKSVGLMSKEDIDKSALYEPMEKVSAALFPYFNKVKDGVSNLKEEYFD